MGKFDGSLINKRETLFIYLCITNKAEVHKSAILFPDLKIVMTRVYQIKIPHFTGKNVSSAFAGAVKMEKYQHFGIKRNCVRGERKKMVRNHGQFKN
jgi:hypothetical protein